jgi:TP901 family phage tail tape measure protein
MSSKTTSWILELVDKITTPLHRVQDQVDNTAESTERLGGKFGKLAAEFGAKAFLFNQAAEGIGRFNDYFQNAIAPGARLETQMAKLSTISGKTGGDLKILEDRAKELGVEFGVGASGMADSFMDVMASLGDSFADSDEAMGLMGRNIGTLSKLMDGDAKGAASALSTAMLQYGVDLNNPVEAAKEATRMMNAMQAAANVGGSEVADTAEALRQSGLLAKQSGLSFEELNASLEGLAKGKIVAGEAGTAMRNILLSMSTLGNAPKQAIQGLQAYGVDIAKAADPAVKFTDRLRELKKIQNDPGLMESVFLKANIAAGQTMLDNIDTIDDWTERITGTNAAIEGAEIMMGTYTETMGRINARIEGFKGNMFSAIEPVAPFVSITGDAVGEVASLGAAVWGLSILFKKDLYTGIWTGIKAMGVWTGQNVIAKVATLATTAAQWALNLSLWANPITWVVIGVTALTVAFIVLWNKCEGFRALMTGLWEVIKNFGKLLKDFIIDRITGFLTGIGSLGEAIAKLFKGDFSGAWESAKSGAAGILGIDARAKAYENAKGLGGAFQKGYADGAASFQAGKREKDGDFSEESTSIGAKSITGNKIPQIKPVNSTNAGKNDSNTISRTGGSGGKSIIMNVTLNISNNGIKNPDEFAEQVVRKINDRLNDALAIAG